MARYAFVKSGSVIRVAEWDGIASVPSDITAVLVGNAQVQIGDTYSNSTFTANPPVDAGRIANYATLIGRGTQALADNATYLAIGSPTNPQVAAQVRALTQQMDALIRLAGGQLDATT